MKNSQNKCLALFLARLLPPYLFDFGDSWKFEAQLERVDPVEANLDQAVILEGRARPPAQYRSWDEEEADETW